MIKYQRFLLCTSLLFVVLNPAADAIIIRHDRLDARYVKLGKEFRAYGDVVGAGSTLISPRWLLTAAHVAKEISPYTSFASIGGHHYAIDRVIIHPDYANNGRTDLALLRLTEVVKGVDPIQLYRSSDEAAQIVTFFGRGQTGNGETGPTAQDGKMRGATNKIETTDPYSIFFQFDKPETATDLEGISGPGDSGGPALLKVRGKWAIAGISSANRGNGKGLCRYETTEIYARVSTCAAWIDATMKNSPQSTVQWKISTSAVWPKTYAGEIGENLIAAHNSGDASIYEAFNQRYRDLISLRRSTPEKRASGFKGLVQKIGKLSIVEFAEDPAKNFLVLFRNESGKFFQLSLYFVDDAKTRFDGFWLGEAQTRTKI